jgi:hypothetical protein
MLIIEIALGVVLGILVLAFLPQILIGIFVLGIAILIWVTDGGQTLETLLESAVVGYIGFRLLRWIARKRLWGKPPARAPRISCILCGQRQYSPNSRFCTQCGSTLIP